MAWLPNWVIVNGCMVMTDEALMQACEGYLKQGRELVIEIVPKDPVTGGHILPINDPMEQ